jgi:pilus assembly protein CpaB
MRTRIIAVVVAAVLAIAGAAALVFAVQGASESALAGTRTETVLVVVAPIAAGTRGEQVGDRIEEREIPVSYLAEGAVGDRDLLAGLVSLVGLEPGEQMIASRWGAPEDLVAVGGRVAAPDGTQEVSLALELERVAGGAILPGSSVGVWSSRDGGTALLLDGVLVTALASTVAADDQGTSTDGDVLVTFALTADQARALVEAAEYGQVWLSLQGQGS